MKKDLIYDEYCKDRSVPNWMKYKFENEIKKLFDYQLYSLECAQKAAKKVFKASFIQFCGRLKRPK